MSIFKQPSTMPNERPPVRMDPPSPGSDSNTGASVIGAAMKVVGDIETTGILKVDGTVQGSIRGARQVVLGRTGMIQGDVHAEEAVLGGRIVGTVSATERVEIQAHSIIEGDIHTRCIVVSEGGVLNGTVRMDTGSAKGTVPAPQVTPLRSTGTGGNS